MICRRAPGPRSANAKTHEHWCEPPKPWRTWRENMLWYGPFPGPMCSRLGLSACDQSTPLDRATTRLRMALLDGRLVGHVTREAEQAYLDLHTLIDSLMSSEERSLLRSRCDLEPADDFFFPVECAT